MLVYLKNNTSSIMSRCTFIEKHFEHLICSYVFTIFDIIHNCFETAQIIFLQEYLHWYYVSNLQYFSQYLTFDVFFNLKLSVDNIEMYLNVHCVIYSKQYVKLVYYSSILMAFNPSDFWSSFSS